MYAVRYFVSLPFDAASRCTCADEALLPAAAVGGPGCCPLAPDDSKCVASDLTDFSTLPASECSERLDGSGNLCQARKTHLLQQLIHKTAISLPRLARDKHRKSTQIRDDAFYCRRR